MIMSFVMLAATESVPPSDDCLGAAMPWQRRPLTCGLTDLPLERLPPLLGGRGASALSYEPPNACYINWAQTDEMPLSGYTFSEAEPVSTSNTGNLVWMYGARLLLNKNVTHIDVDFAQRNSLTASALLMPQANILRPYEASTAMNIAHVVKSSASLEQTVRQLNVPTLALGIGMQAAHTQNPRNLTLPAGQLQFLQSIAERGAFSVRGHFTERVIRHNAGPKPIVAGCPSLFVNMQANLGELLEHAYRAIPRQAERRSLKFAVGLPTNSNDCRPRLCLNLLQLVADNPGSFVVIQQSSDYAIINKYGAQTALPYNSTRFFYDVHSWARALHAVDAVIAPRIHGSMMGLAAVKPTVTIATDARIMEMTDVMQVPYFLHRDSALHSTPRLDARRIFQSAADQFDGNAFDANRRRLAAKYRSMFDLIKMPLHPAVLEMAQAHDAAASATASTVKGEAHSSRLSSETE